MNIKLRARLSAYSKVDSVAASASYVPVPEVSEQGHVLGVGSSGEYTLLGKATFTDIDTLFVEQGENIVSKDQIDALFPDVTNDFSNIVDKDKIDDLFNDKESVNKPSNVVSYAQIDSLFK